MKEKVAAKKKELKENEKIAKKIERDDRKRKEREREEEERG